MPALWMIVASLLFACMGVCVKLGSAHFSAGEMVFWRGAAGVLLVAVLARAQGVALRTPRWRLQVSRALAGSLALMCYFIAIGVLPLATAVTLSYTSPIFVAVLLAAFALAAVGWVLFRRGAAGGGSPWESNPPARVLATHTGFEDQGRHQTTLTPPAHRR